MNSRNEALLEQAKKQSYLVMPYGHNNSLVAKYFEWCQAEKVPAIIVTYHGQSAFLDTNTEPVFLGYFRSNTPIDSAISFVPTPELQERLDALSEKLIASVSRRNRGRGSVLSGNTIHASYIGQE
ncbi:MAG: hypothetical protein WBN92_18940, partial [Terriglobia bacterium]